MKKIFLLLMISFVAFPCFASRYMVTYENSESLRTLGKEVIFKMPSLNMAVFEIKNDAQLESLRALPGILNIEKEIFYPAPKMPIAPAYLGDPGKIENMPSPYGLSMIKAQEAWKKSRGRSARVLVIDSGVDSTHPALLNRVEKGRNFFEDRPKEDFSDGLGHGTHVSGIILGSETRGFSGVAPEAKLLAARVCSNEKCSSIAIAQALAWALEEKVDVVNLSLGGGSSLSGKWAIDRLDSARIPVVAAVGNSGAEGIPSPAVFPSVTAVGAVNQKGARAAFSNWGDALDVMAPGVSIISSVPRGTGRVSSIEAFSSGSKPEIVRSVTFQESALMTEAKISHLVNAGMGRAEDITGVDFKDQIAFVKRGEIPLMEKIKNLQAAGAAAIVISNNVDGLDVGSLSENGEVLGISVVMIEKSVGEHWALDLMNSKEVKISLKVMPSDYIEMSGTSMACPYVTGIVALMRSARPGLSSWRIRQILDSTAGKMDGGENNKNGHGLVNAEAAVLESLRY